MKSFLERIFKDWGGILCPCVCWSSFVFKKGLEKNKISVSATKTWTLNQHYCSIYKIASTEDTSVSQTWKLWWMSSCNFTAVFCPQVVYSSSARALKMETVKPDKPEKEEDDIDIDAIWETRMMKIIMLFLCCGFDSQCPLQPKWLAFPSFTHPTPPPHPQSSALWHDLT